MLIDFLTKRKMRPVSHPGTHFNIINDIASTKPYKLLIISSSIIRGLHKCRISKMYSHLYYR